jgi:hypothetical protein
MRGDGFIESNDKALESSTSLITCTGGSTLTIVEELSTSIVRASEGDIEAIPPGTTGAVELLSMDVSSKAEKVVKSETAAPVLCLVLGGLVARGCWPLFVGFEFDSPVPIPTEWRFPRGRWEMKHELPSPRRRQWVQGAVPEHRFFASRQALQASAALWRWLESNLGRGIARCAGRRRSVVCHHEIFPRQEILDAREARPATQPQIRASTVRAEVPGA